MMTSVRNLIQIYIRKVLIKEKERLKDDVVSIGINYVTLISYLTVIYCPINELYLFLSDAVLFRTI